jgi:beta-lactamase regulating signal transducer with metallopeptidase domain
VQLGLVLIAAPTVLRAAGVESVADACHRVLGPVLPGGAVTGWLTASVSVALMGAARASRARSRRAQRDARIEPWLGEHQQLADATVVVLPTDTVVAYATTGAPPQVVLSRGLAAALSTDELDAVVAHELAHLRNRHHRDLVLATAIDATLGWVPGVRASTGALRLSIERWADEEVAEHPGARECIRRALLKTTETLLGPVPAFTAAFTLVARLDALAVPLPTPDLRQRALVFGPLAGLTVLAASSVLAWSFYTHHSVLGLVGFCPL